MATRGRVRELVTRLRELALNLRWTWDRETRALFHEIHPELWDQIIDNPWLLVRARRLCALPLELADRLVGRGGPLRPPRWLHRVGGGVLQARQHFLLGLIKPPIAPAQPSSAGFDRRPLRGRTRARAGPDRIRQE